MALKNGSIIEIIKKFRYLKHSDWLEKVCFMGVIETQSYSFENSKLMRGVFNGFLYHKTNKKSLDCALFCC